MKQVWSLLTNEGALVWDIFKTKYFPNTSILNAELGRNPSYIWKSFWKAKNSFKMVYHGELEMVQASKSRKMVGWIAIPAARKALLEETWKNLKLWTLLLISII